MKPALTFHLTCSSIDQEITAGLLRATGIAFPAGYYQKTELSDCFNGSRVGGVDLLET
jgi:hypothetical protein